MDTVITNSGAVAVTTNRISTRSNRKGKSKTPNPKKLWELLGMVVEKKPPAEGIQELHKEHVRDSPTFFNFFKSDNKGKNKKKDIFLYDSSRVILTDKSTGGDYIHASYVDGMEVWHQYIMCQCPFSSDTVIDFWRMVIQLKLEVVALCMGSKDEDAKFLCQTPRAGPFQIKMELVKSDGSLDIYNVSISGKGDHKMKLVAFNGWTDDAKPPSAEFGKFKDCVIGSSSWANDEMKSERSVQADANVTVSQSTVPLRPPLCIVCRTGCSRSSIFVLFHAETERLKIKKRIKVTERIKNMRQQRAFSMDSCEVFEAGVQLIHEVAKKG